MKPPTGYRAQISETLEAIRRDLARLGERVAALEAAAGMKAREATPPVHAEAAALNEEILLVISAAVAAFLGKRPHVCQIRLLGSAAWVQQGRVTIQASHALSVKHR
jgi:methylmalonyl-CoA carboxyltransferase large subunit